MEQTNPTAKGIYAGFWIRFVAYLIDSAILMIPMQTLNWIITKLLVGTWVTAPTGAADSLKLTVFLTQMWLGLGVSVLYYGVLQARWSGSIGKRMCGLRLLNTDLKPRLSIKTRGISGSR